MEKIMRDKRQGTRDRGRGTRRILFALLVAGFLLLVAPSAEAASLYFFPSSGSYNVGQIFSASVYVSSVDQAMNAASGIISFPQDKLEVISLSKTGSIFTLWVQEPLFSNSAGTINFEGIVLNPGFTGATGKIITINFKIKAAGVALLNFSSGSALANDGKGTNILANLGNAQFSLGGAGPSISEATTPSIISDTPPAPQISSPTHPDPNKWYSKNTAKFMWLIPSSDVVAVRLLYDKYPNSQPRVIYEQIISEKEITDLKDGVYYFHIQFKNNKGWGAISHFRFQIDTQPPEPFEIKFIDGKETNNPRPTVIFDTTDTLSGIDYYKIKIGEGNFFNITPEIIKNNSYILSLQVPGKRSILVQAYDKAGNYAVATEEFVIKPIEPPTIIDYPKELKEGENLIIKGKTEPNSIVKISLQRDDIAKLEFQEGQSDEKGEFIIIWNKKLASDIYKFWAEVTDGRGAQSGRSDAYVISLTPTALFRIGSLMINYFTLIISLMVIIIALIFLGTYLWFKYKMFKRRLKKETIEAEKILRNAFDVLSRNIIYHIKLLEKVKSQRPLTKEENVIIAKCKEDLTQAEKIIGKEIEDIEKEM